MTDDDLCSPHECIMLTVGNRAPPCKTEVIDWPRFDWKDYDDVTAVDLGSLYANWIDQYDSDCGDLDVLAQELTACLQKCIEKVATMRSITKHSKPWFSMTLSDRFKHVRKLKRK